ncbi:MAG: hypothetical protein LBC83_05565 [Oscillospiraceae bacterium]|jgi:hypothetical protein|nr:hypothetical protein [Oscillospiraceae bacterium]
MDDTNQKPAALPALLFRWLRLRICFRCGLLRLRLKAVLSSLRGSRAGRRFARLRRTIRKGARQFRPAWGLTLCALVTIAAIVFTALVHGAPELRGLSGVPLPGENLLLLDPFKKDETTLVAGRLYDRPIAAVQIGAQPLLLRVRVDEILLRIREDDAGLAVVPMPTRSPGENYSPRTLDQTATLRLLTEGGYCAKDADWAAARQNALPAKRLPPEDSGNSGKLLVFEKRTVENPVDITIDISSLLPEDLEDLGINKVIYSHIGFYDLGGGLYQPLFIAVEKSANDAPPKITKLSFQFYAWDIEKEAVHIFGQPEEDASISLSAPELQPVSAWGAPADGWFYDDDGWVYYGKILQPGEMTPLLLEHFTVPPGSPLTDGSQTRYRLEIAPQSIPLDAKLGYEGNKAAVLAMWNGSQSSQIGQTAANILHALLQSL